MSTIEELGFPALPPESVQTTELEPTPEPQPIEQTAETPRDERGRFAPRQEEATPAPDDARQRPPEGFVPVSALQKMREELRELKQQLPQQPAQRAQQDAYANMTPQQRAEFDYRNQMLNTHELIARSTHGVEVVEAAKQWWQEVGSRDPGAVAAIQNSPYPYEELVEHFMAEVQARRMMQLMQQGFDPNDPDRWALERARALAAQQQQQAPPQQPMPNAPRSISGIPSAGNGVGPVPTGPGQAFDSLFK